LTKRKVREVSRQRLHQLAKIAAGKCKLCPERRAPGDRTFCARHREQKREQNREYMRKARAAAAGDES
jgi:hypothetical protein